MPPIVLIMQSIINQAKILFLNSSVKDPPPRWKIAKSGKGLKSMYQDKPIKFSISRSSLTPHALWVPRML